MLVLVQATVMTVGLDGREETLRELPIQLINLECGQKAARSLKTEKIDSVISRWSLDGMEDGLFLKRLKAVKPNIPTIAFVKAGDKKQEIAARSLGVSAVLTDEVSDEMFQQTVANVLGLKDVITIKSIAPMKRPKSRRYSRNQVSE